LQPEMRIVGVQAERAPSYFLSWTEGRAIGTDSCDTIADGLATRTPLPENVDAIRELVDEVRLVSEQQLLEAVRFLWHEEQVISEPSGAAATAALLAGPRPGVCTAALVTGANISDEVRLQSRARQ
jgi:threonine dehydratase